MTRAEAIKKKLAPSPQSQKPQPPPSNKPVTSSGKIVPPLGFGAFDSDDESQGSRSQGQKVNRSGRGPSTGPVSVGAGAYTKEEIEVLRFVLASGV